MEPAKDPGGQISDRSLIGNGLDVIGVVPGRTFFQVHDGMIRDAVYAGRWYPGDPDELDRLVSYGTEAGDKARLAVLPHAGLYYSHRGIAHFFARMEEGIQRIIILSPSHYVYLRPDHILTGRFEGFLTPYGTIKGEDLIGFDEGGEAAIQKEHAVEMVLPFIAKRPGVSVSMI